MACFLSQDHIFSLTTNIGIELIMVNLFEEEKKKKSTMHIQVSLVHSPTSIQFGAFRSCISMPQISKNVIDHMLIISVFLKIVKKRSIKQLIKEAPNWLFYVNYYYRSRQSIYLDSFDPIPKNNYTIYVHMHGHTRRKRIITC